MAKRAAVQPQQTGRALTKRERDVILLRKHNLSYRQIAEQLDITEPAVETAFRRALAACPAPDVEEMRVEMVQECYTQMESLRERMADVRSDEAYAQLQGSYFRWVERLCKISGVDAPERHRIDVFDAAAVMELVRDLRAQRVELEQSPLSLPPIITASATIEG